MTAITFRFWKRSKPITLTFWEFKNIFLEFDFIFCHRRGVARVGSKWESLGRRQIFQVTYIYITSRIIAWGAGGWFKGYSTWRTVKLFTKFYPKLHQFSSETSPNFSQNFIKLFSKFYRIFPRISLNSSKNFIKFLIFLFYRKRSSSHNFVAFWSSKIFFWSFFKIFFTTRLVCK